MFMSLLDAQTFLISFSFWRNSSALVNTRNCCCWFYNKQKRVPKRVSEGATRMVLLASTTGKGWLPPKSRVSEAGQERDLATRPRLPQKHEMSKPR
ncbi:uncharacterized protein BDZ83DRAFT_453187 [Colletotrichum acutatum]|uniref:Secreted protein n=1 Tax=Glomerella acutata TaxID=27357 RepID=A0AAD8XMF3_GLOAC|nr:uncharacterized protein BDZ83DRAFT_453187 [Colletotrichum acutatum]KAK1729993.1 hypothetical protein BDZ83DRAFT_453187 [Colletotrichum acutatum]